MKKRNTVNVMNEDEKEIFRFIVIIIVILLVVGIVYLVSYLKSKKNEYHYNEVTPGEVNTEIVTVGTMLNKDEDEYYVVLYKDDDTKAIYYNNIVNDYVNKENTLNVYYCNLNNKLNEDYLAVDGKTNPKAKDISDLKLGDFTLIKVKKGKIAKYIEDTTEFEKELTVDEKN